MNYLAKKYKNLRVYIKAFSLVTRQEWLTEKPIYIFNHIPKCGGTSLLNILGNWFVIERDYPPHDLKFPDPTELVRQFDFHRANLKDYASHKPWRMIAGHYHMANFHLADRYPLVETDPRVRLITFLRDPLEQRVSSYYYGKKRNHKYVHNISLRDYIFSWSNYYAACMSCTSENYKEKLSGYFFVGILEEFDKSIAHLSQKLRRPLWTDRVPKMNISEREINQGLTDDDISFFKQKNSLDYEIYDYARHLLASNQ